MAALVDVGEQGRHLAQPLLALGGGSRAGLGHLVGAGGGDPRIEPARITQVEHEGGRRRRGAVDAALADEQARLIHLQAEPGIDALPGQARLRQLLQDVGRHRPGRRGQGQHHDKDGKHAPHLSPSPA
jgi:hypothetical protein